MTNERSCATTRRSAIHRFLEAFAGGEPRPPRCLDLDRLAGARIAALARRTLHHAELAEPHDLHLAALLERRRDGAEGRVDRRGRGCLGHAGPVGPPRRPVLLWPRNVL